VYNKLGGSWRDGTIYGRIKDGRKKGNKEGKKEGRRLCAHTPPEGLVSHTLCVALSMLAYCYKSNVTAEVMTKVHSSRGSIIAS